MVMSQNIIVPVVGVTIPPHRWPTTVGPYTLANKINNVGNASMSLYHHIPICIINIKCGAANQNNMLHIFHV